MCGIVGAVSKKNVVSVLMDGLKNLEYRGYDSAGIVIIDEHQQFERHRTVGKVNVLQSLLEKKPLIGTTGLAHTRWATHGKPSELNAHPHTAGVIAVVHNGIIENYQSIRSELHNAGCILTSETDTELIAHLMNQHILAGFDLLTAARKLTSQLEGAFAVGLIHCQEPGRMLALRRGSPLIIGLSRHENFIASDQMALLPVTSRFIFLEDGDIADIHADQVLIYDEHAQKVERPIYESELNQRIATKGPYAHFMLKEIMEQPEAILSTLESRITRERVLAQTFGVKAPDIFKAIHRVQIVACGTSYHAGLVAKYWLEDIAGLPCQVEIASEYRYRQKVVEPDNLFVTLSQSGETADTLAALRSAKQSGFLATLAICNVPESSIVRESDLVFMTHAGPEIGVASTKAFTTQLVSLFLLSIVLGRERRLDAARESQLVTSLRNLPFDIQQVLTLDSKIKNAALTLVNKINVLFLGRGLEFPIALEGALKLKEISYIHASAYPAGELKHGPIALIDAELSVIFLAPFDNIIDKLKSNLQEILARGGQLIVFADKKTNIEETAQMQIITMPAIESYLAPILYVIPLQLLAYHVAVLKGTDVDQPRNLAKSVTVE